MLRQFIGEKKTFYSQSYKTSFTCDTHKKPHDLNLKGVCSQVLSVLLEVLEIKLNKYYTFCKKTVEDVMREGLSF